MLWFSWNCRDRSCACSVLMSGNFIKSILGEKMYFMHYNDLASGQNEDVFFSFFLHIRFTGRKLHVMNFGSYNYLGFAESKTLCSGQVQNVTRKYGVGVGGSRQELGKVWNSMSLILCVCEGSGVCILAHAFVHTCTWVHAYFIIKC